MPRTKLSDSQLVILSTAARRDDGAVLPISKSLKIKGAALTNTLQGLIRRRLIQEEPAGLGTEAWRRASDG